MLALQAALAAIILAGFYAIAALITIVTIGVLAVGSVIAAALKGATRPRR